MQTAPTDSAMDVAVPTRLSLRFLALLIVSATAIAGCGRDVVPDYDPASMRTSADAANPDQGNADPINTANNNVLVRDAFSVTRAGRPGIAMDGTEGGIEGSIVSCSTCHSMKTPKPAQRGKTLTRFHTDLTVNHGSLTCLSCHNPGNYDTLRLADGRSIAFEQVMQLCAQCHGPQAKAFEHGAHGGMTGFWDTTRGTQTRNQCTHCHAPHQPAFPRMRPTFKPQDRFLKPHDTHEARGHPSDLSGSSPTKESDHE